MRPFRQAFFAVEAETITTIGLYEKVQANNLDKEMGYVNGGDPRDYRNVELRAWLDRNPRIERFLPTCPQTLPNFRGIPTGNVGLF